MRKRLGGMLGAMAVHRQKAGRLASALGHFLKVSRSYWGGLFACYVDKAQEMQAGYTAREDLHRAVADYIAGMTDRFAIREHERLTGRRLLG